MGAQSTIDLNSDLGEGFGHWSLGDDDALLGVVTSANVACGFHAGDASIMRVVCDRRPSAASRSAPRSATATCAGFGRRFIDIEPEALTQDVIYQIGALQAFARVAGSPGRATSSRTAPSTTRSCTTRSRRPPWSRRSSTYDPTLPVLGLPGSALAARWPRRPA